MTYNVSGGTLLNPTLCFTKIQIGFTFLLPAHVCVCVCVVGRRMFQRMHLHWPEASSRVWF